MMKTRFGLRKGQSAVEYAVAILCFITALLAMQGYISRSLQGKMRVSADAVGEQYDRTSTSGSSTHTYNHTSNTVTTTSEVAGVSTTTINTDFSENETDNRSETIGP